MNSQVSQSYDPATGARNYAVPAPPSEQQGASLQMSMLLPVLWRRLWIIVVCLVVCTLGGWLYVKQSTPLYRSTARLFVDRAGPQLIRSGEVDGMSREFNYRLTQAEMLRSMPVLSKLLDNPEIVGARTFADTSNLMEAIRRGLDVNVGADQLIYVSFDSPYPQESARVVNTIIEGYVEFSNEQKRSSAAEVLRILQREKEKQDKELSVRLKKLTDYRIASGELALGTGKGNVLLDQLTASSEALSQLQLKLVEARELFNAAQSMSNDPDQLRAFVESQRSKGVFVTGQSEDQKLRAELDELRVAQFQMERQLGPEHAFLNSFRQRVAVLEARLAQADKKYVANQLAVAEQYYLAVQRQAEDLARTVDNLRNEAKGLNSQLAEYELLRSEYDQTRSMVDILNSRIKELNITENAGAMNVMVLEVARPTDDPFSPNPSKIMKFAVTFGLILGVCAALGLEFLDDRIRSVEQVTAAVALPVLGVVPDTAGTAQDRQQAGRLVELSPHSSASEIYRTIRTGIFFSSPEGKTKVILITSPSPGDGKTTVASNLALALAQSGQRTLLLDADFRKPRIHAVFGMDNEHGLSSAVALQEPVEQLVKPGPIEDLWVIPSGPVPPNPAELLNSGRFKTLLATLSGQYDHIVIDSPPVLPVTDARILGADADLVVVVLRAEKSRRKSARHAVEAMQGVGAKILGVVINGAPRRGGNYGYYDQPYDGYYGEGYGGYGTYGKKPPTPPTTPPGSSPTIPAAPPQPT